MTEQEYYKKLSDFQTRNLKRSLIPHKEFNQKEFFDFQQEYHNFIMDYHRQKQQEIEAEKQLEKEIEDKLQDCVESALDDLFKGFNGNINIKL